ncbi:hypothetical protein BaRGS_00025570, partial [Batillaria attramentaria]
MSSALRAPETAFCIELASGDQSRLWRRIGFYSNLIGSCRKFRPEHAQQKLPKLCSAGTPTCWSRVFVLSEEKKSKSRANSKWHQLMDTGQHLRMIKLVKWVTNSKNIEMFCADAATIFDLLDELPMIYGSALLIYGILMLESPEGQTHRGLVFGLFSYCAVVTAAAYALMVFTMLFGSLRIVLKHKVHWTLYLTSIITYTSGFLLWNVDNLLCHQLRSLRREQIHSAATPLFECHAWWHILAGVGTYLSLLFITHTRYSILKKSPQVK